MYEKLAKYYQALVGSEQGSEYFYTLIQKFNQGNRILDCACGTGDLVEKCIANQLDAHGFDLSKKMLEKTKTKNNFKVFNMTNFHYSTLFHTIVCFCDSLNYLLEEQALMQFFQNVYQHLELNGIFLFDMHQYDTLTQFEEEYYTTGVIDGITYQWQIVAQNDLLLHTFLFDDEKEEHIQRVYQTDKIIAMLEKIGFIVEVLDRSIIGEYCLEKVVFLARKGV